MNKGMVYLVGAGPGELDLMTRRAYKLIQQADCLVYDHLVDRRILEATKINCEQIYVGKIKRHHVMKQEDINKLLVEKASEYECVVRLKGGDVYVFGRGGEEGRWLKEHEIPFEVIPGVSSSIGGLAYAGIPITQRGLTTGFRVVTAHSQQNQLAEIDFEGMAKTNDTCVFLMGLTKVDEIVVKLLEAGKNKDSKVAVVSRATYADQKVVVSTLEHIREEMEKCPLPSPAIIVVGEVVGMRRYLNFYEEKKLFGKKVLLPRVGGETTRLYEMLKELGANITEVQVSQLIEKEDALDGIDYQLYTHVVLSSRSAVRFFIKSMRKNHIDIRKLAHIRFAVVGEATERALWECGIQADIVPDVYESAVLLERLKEEVVSDSHVLIPKVEGESTIWEDLSDICEVTVIDLYKNSEIEALEWKNQLEKEWDMAIFTCSSSVDRIMNMKSLYAKQIFSIGNKTSESLEKYQIQSYKQAKHANYESLVDAILKAQE